MGVPKEKIMYVGDSQTDVQVVEWLKGEGLTIMFNGKGRVCYLSDIMYIGEDAGTIEWLADYFATAGRQAILDWYRTPRGFLGHLIATVTPENAKDLEEESVKKRKKFRGVAIGELT